MESFLDRVKSWCEGRHWPGRAVLLAFFVYLGIRYLGNPQYHSMFDGINLGIHEAGHLLFRFLGSDFLYMAGGTLLQVAAPLFAMIMFVRQPDYFAVPICGCWLATNLYGVATYMADARARALPLVTVGGGDARHDWYYLFSRMGLLSMDTTIAGFVRVLAFLSMWGGIAVAVWILYRMAVSTLAERTTSGVGDYF